MATHSVLPWTCWRASIAPGAPALASGMPMHTGPTLAGPAVPVVAAAQPQMSIGVGGLPALVEPEPEPQRADVQAAEHAADWENLHSQYRVRLADGTKAVAYSATPSPTKKRQAARRRIQRGEPRHSTPGGMRQRSPTRLSSVSRSPSIPDRSVSVPLPQYDLGGGFTLHQRLPLYVPTRPGFIVPDRLAPADDPAQAAALRAQAAALSTVSAAGRETIARQELAPAVGSPQRPAGKAGESGGGGGGDSSAECSALRAEVQRLSSMLAAEEGKRRLLTDGLAAARAEIKQQREQLQAKDVELEASRQQLQPQQEEQAAAAPEPPGAS